MSGRTDDNAAMIKAVLANRRLEDRAVRAKRWISQDPYGTLRDWQRCHLPRRGLYSR